MTEDIIDTLLKTLQMPAVRTQYPQVAQQAREEQWSYETFLEELLHREADSRRQRRIKRYEKQAKLPTFKDMNNFELDRFGLPLRQKMETLINGDFISRAENVLIFGAPGTGKTHFAAALGYELVRREYKVLFTLCSTLVQELLAAKQELALPKKLKQLSRFDLLIIDEIGYIQQNRDEMEVLFTLLADRYETRSIVITSNLPFSKWGAIFKDEMLAAAAIDRLVHHSIVLKMNVENFRLQEKKQAASQNNSPQ